ncbi:isoprenylcysteine carboxyl methyltransferase family protein [Bacillus sp. JJ1764]|uniref:isoprenylcysteine carboxyl methyltransferase family protein n=1 Tax=Bacillus sp. JJ1764 TaxID=3122964 RepID=UPI002FFFB64A
MKDVYPFTLFFAFIVIQRIGELMVAKSNEKWMKMQGALEFGGSHYRMIVLIHLLFFCSFLSEKVWFNHGLSTIWPEIIGIFFLTQVLRIWAIASLGRYWNTKIIVLPNAKIVRKGPYRWIKHPNYVVVTLELMMIPLLFNAYITTCLFTILNMIVLRIRIPEEERALITLTEYDQVFNNCERFFPKIVK